MEVTWMDDRLQWSHDTWKMDKLQIQSLNHVWIPLFVTQKYVLYTVFRNWYILIHPTGLTGELDSLRFPFSIGLRKILHTSGVQAVGGKRKKSCLVGLGRIFLCPTPVAATIPTWRTATLSRCDEWRRRRLATCLPCSPSHCDHSAMTPTLRTIQTTSTNAASLSSRKLIQYVEAHVWRCSFACVKHLMKTAATSTWWS